MSASEQNLRPSSLPQVTPVTLLAIVNIALAILGLIPWGVNLRGNLHLATALHIRLAQHTGMNLSPNVLLLLSLDVPMIVASIGLLRRRPWGRYLTLILAVVIAIQVAVNLVVLGPSAVVGLYTVYPVLVFGVLLNRRVLVEFRRNIF